MQGEYDKKKSFIVGHMKETEDKNDREDADYTETKKIPLRKKVVVEPTESVQKDNDDEKPEESESESDSDPEEEDNLDSDPDYDPKEDD